MMKAIKVATIITTVVLLCVVIPFIVGGIEGGVDFYSLLFKGLMKTNSQQPKIRYGEFPFILVYQLNGVEITLCDTLICEYNGIEWVGDFAESFVKWSSRLKSGKKRLTLLEIGDASEVYYQITGWDMDNSMTTETEYFSRNAWRVDIYPDYEEAGYWISEEELLSQYGIKIISYSIKLVI